jgi:7-cyano-7-deazaguanine synthase
MTSSAVLFSGGLDSAVLLAHERQSSDRVVPIHVRSGLAWEAAEADAIRRLLRLAPFAGRVEPPKTLTADLTEIYPAHHWAITGAAPAYDTPDEDVYLQGRNITLIARAAVFCARQHLDRLVLGPLAGNPFPDATPEFFAAMARAMTLGLAHTLAIAAPFRTWHKEEVIRRGVELGVPLGDTLSCMNAAGGGGHCGVCSKCRERQEAFHAAGIPDPTSYAERWTPRS